MYKDNVPPWLDIAIGLIVVMLWSGGTVLLRGERSGAEFKFTYFIGRTLLGTVSPGGALGLFFGLRALASIGLGRICLTNKFAWLDISTGMFVAVLWAYGVGLILDEKFNPTNLAERTLVGAAALGGMLGLFFGLRLLVYMGLRRIGLVE